MRLRDKTIEELFDLEDELRELTNEEEEYYPFILLYEELFRKIRLDKSGEYNASLEEVKKRLISYLIRFGTYMKTQYEKDDHAAESSLKKAIKYDPMLPIAHYRLGFLSYKHENYLSATVHFKQAITYQTNCSEPDYRLNQQQLYNAHVYLTNSSLYLAEAAQNSLKTIETNEMVEGLPSYHKSSFYEMIRRNEQYLAANAFTVLLPTGQRYCTREECEEIAEQNHFPDSLILFFSDRDHSIWFNGRQERLSLNQAEMLRYFFLKTNQQSPATKLNFARLFETRNEDREIPDNNYVQAVRRLNRKINLVGVPHPIIEPVPNGYHGQTAYYCNHTLSFAVIYRNDSNFILEI